MTQLNIGQQLVGLKKRTGREGEQKKYGMGSTGSKAEMKGSSANFECRAQSCWNSEAMLWCFAA